MSPDLEHSEKKYINNNGKKQFKIIESYNASSLLSSNCQTKSYNIENKDNDN